MWPPWASSARGFAVSGAQGRVPAPDLAGAYADYRDVLDQDQVYRRPGPAAAGKADGEDAPAPVDAAHRFVEYIAAHRVVDQVGAAAAGDFLHLVAKAAEGTVRLRVVDDGIRPTGLDDRKLVVATPGADDVGAVMLAEVHRGHAHAAGGAMHQQPFAGLEVAADP